MNRKGYILSIALALGILVFNTCFAQSANNFSFRLLSSDYQYLVNRNNDIRYADGNRFFTGVELGYFRSIATGVDIGFPLRVGKVSYALSGTDINLIEEQSFYSFGLSAFFKSNNEQLLPVDALLAPYATLGVEGNRYGKQGLEFNVPVGVGVSFQPVNGLNIQGQTAYHFGATNFLVHTMGLYLNLDKK